MPGSRNRCGLFTRAGLVALACVTGCGPTTGPVERLEDLAAQELQPLPRPITNNAVAYLEIGNKPLLFSFLGLGSGKTWSDTLSESYVLDFEAGPWRRLQNVPGEAGRLAGAAAGIGTRVYVFGGYTVDESGDEYSVPDVWAYDMLANEWQQKAPMPIPVDDAVLLSYEDRFLYLVSGWHDLGNVNLVQVYDIETNTWAQATPFPGTPVFGHAGGIVGSIFVICDGVKIVTQPRGKREFKSSAECYLGAIDSEDYRRIDWFSLPPHPKESLYRMAATGTRRGGPNGTVIFAGGSANPYNYNGIGYDGVPATPSDVVFGFDLATQSWKTFGRLPSGTMDHRGLIELDDGFLVIGGMRENQHVSDTVISFTLPLE